MTSKFATLFLTLVLVGCIPTANVAPTTADEPLPLTRPDVSVYEADDGGICFAPADATNFFLYVNELEQNQ